MNRKVQLAVIISGGLHGILLALGRYRLSFDAYVHMFFADHYRRNWWALWEPRWYTGFTVVAYPPLVHQIIAALSMVVGIEWAWAIVLLSVLMALPSGVYAFSRLFVGRHAAGYAALVSTVLPSIALTAHTFGQLPTLAGLLGSLWGMAVFGEYIKYGNIRDGALAVTLIAVIVASHHGTLLFLPWGMGTVCLHILSNRQVAWSQWLYRVSLFSLIAGGAILGVIWPFWLWGMNQTMQVPIDHASRHNFLLDPALFLFFWPMYGPLVLVIPWMLRSVYRSRRIFVGLLFLFMFILGLGGTTPLPRWLYGKEWEWLTYDRFALWASIALLPSVGLLAVVVDEEDLVVRVA